MASHRMPLTAAHYDLLLCHVCKLVSRRPTQQLGDTVHCPRCGTFLHPRQSCSLTKTWAFLICAYILYIPANILPITETTYLFGSQNDTIMSGAVYFWASGSWLIAAVIFLASVVTPLFKLIALTLLVISVQRRSPWKPHRRARLYRLIEFIGRWSMLDIYVVALLVTLVRIPSLATIKAGPGALAFGAVVVFTLCATLCFDPRLIWDCAERRKHD